MACFTAPLAEAIVVSVVKKVALKKGSSNEKIQVAREKLATLEKMLYGGSILLAVEHFYHGEISFVPPFLTAMKTPEEIPVMLHEIATVGVAMAALVTLAWGIGIFLSRFVKKWRHSKSLLFTMLMFTSAALMWSVDGMASVMQGEPFFEISIENAILSAIILACGFAIYGILFIVEKKRKIVSVN